MRLKVAKAAEKERPRDALELHRKEAESLITQRNRESYRAACGQLKKVRELYNRLREGAAWTKYVAGLREQHRNLRALQDELQKAKL